MSNLTKVRKELTELMENCNHMTNAECQSYINRLQQICADYDCEEAISQICDSEFIAEQISYELERHGGDAIFSIKNLLEDVTDRSAQYFYQEGDGNFANLTKQDFSNIIEDILNNYLPDDDDDVDDDSEIEDFPS